MKLARSLHSSGFTLVELLMVMGVLGVLVTFVSVRLVGVEKGARDSRRQSDLKQYQTALETYATKNSGLYPARTSTVSANTLCVATVLNLTGCATPPNTLAGQYNYQSDGTGTRFVLWSNLEKEQTVQAFVICSTGKTGTMAGSSVNPSNGSCPLP